MTFFMWMMIGTALVFLIVFVLPILVIMWRKTQQPKVVVATSGATPSPPAKPAKSDQISRTLRIFYSPAFLGIIFFAAAVIAILFWLEVITVDTFSWFEFTTAIKLAVLLILSGLALLLISTFIGRVTIVLGIVALLLGILFPNTVAWLSIESLELAGTTTTKVVVPAGGCVVEDNTDPRYYFLGQPEDPARGYPRTFIKEDTRSPDWTPYADGDHFVFIKWCGDRKSDQVMIVTRTLM